MKYIKLFPALPLAFLFGSCLAETPLKIPFQSYAPVNLSDGWNISEPSDENIDGGALKDIYRDIHNDDNLFQIRSMLVFRNNNLVAESYMKDLNDRTNLSAVWSCTKQISAVLTGIAVDKGLISVNDPISNYLREAQNTNKSGISIENLLMMKSGINFNNSGFNGETSQLLRKEPSNSLDFILNLDMSSIPGTRFNYNDGDPQIISAILQRRTGKTMRDWAKEVLFDKIGMNKLQWHIYKDGITMGAFGILTTPREIAKIGRLILNNGMWGAESIVSADWIAKMTSPKVPANETHESNITFGYYWWGDGGRDLQIMRGQGGQYVFINKSKGLIVVITSEPNTQGDFQLSLEIGLSIYDRVNNTANEI